MAEVDAAKLSLKLGPSCGDIYCYIYFTYKYREIEALQVDDSHVVVLNLWIIPCSLIPSPETSQKIVKQQNLFSKTLI